MLSRDSRALGLTVNANLMESLEQQSVRRPLARAIFAEMLISTYDEGECPSELQNALQSLRDPEIPLEVGRNLSAVADQFDRTEGLHVDERAQNVSSEELSKYERFKNVRGSPSPSFLNTSLYEKSPACVFI